jgi:hypothetical protein
MGRGCDNIQLSHTKPVHVQFFFVLLGVPTNTNIIRVHGASSQPVEMCSSRLPWCTSHSISTSYATTFSELQLRER